MKEKSKFYLDCHLAGRKYHEGVGAVDGEDSAKETIGTYRLYAKKNGCGPSRKSKTTNLKTPKTIVKNERINN